MSRTNAHVKYVQDVDSSPHKVRDYSRPDIIYLGPTIRLLRYQSPELEYDNSRRNIHHHSLVPLYYIPTGTGMLAS